MKNNSLNPQACPTSEMIKYSLGSCTEALILYTFFGFSMLYYTKALGLTAELAGWATLIATFWDAIADPIIGHISDNTRSRFGKRFHYVAVGGVLMIILFFFIWYVPDIFKNDMTIGTLTIPAAKVLFAYLVMMNLLLRTAYAVFAIPYTALGFEICTDYGGRSKLQGIRSGMSMAANLLGPAMAWIVFFPNNEGLVKDTQIAQNYIHMGAIFGIVAFIFLVIMLFFMAKYIKDSRPDAICHAHVGAFFKNMKDIIFDVYPRWVFIFMIFVSLGVTTIGTLQMYVFDDFMQLTGAQKSIAHGGTMIGMGLGSVALAIFVRRFDKKIAVYLAVTWSLLCELILAGLFLTGFMPPDQTLGGFPIAVALFAFFHSAYWFGNGILLPTAVAMIADVSEVHRLKYGDNKDASYAAVYTLATKIATGVAALLVGYCLTWTGFQSGADAVQTPESMWRVGAMTFVAGPVLQFAGLICIHKYPVTKEFIDKLRAQTEADKPTA